MSLRIKQNYATEKDNHFVCRLMSYLMTNRNALGS